MPWFEELPAAVTTQAEAARNLPPIKVDARTAELLRIGVPNDEEMALALQGSTDPWRDRMDTDFGAALADDRQRAALFSVAPELAPHLERVWQRGGEFPAPHLYSTDRPDPPFHDGARSTTADERWERLVQPLLALGRTYRADLPWLLQWSAALGGAPALGTAAAFAVDDGDTTIAAILDDLIASTGELPGWSAVIPTALLRQRDRAAWTRAHELLLAAGNQEGTRQAIAAAAGTASIDAFLVTLDLIDEHELYRFASIVQLASGWFARPDLRAADRAGNADLIAFFRRLLADPKAIAAAIVGPDLDDVDDGLLALGIHDLSSSIELASSLLAEHPIAERRSAALSHLMRCPDRDDARAAITIALADEDLRIVSYALGKVAWWDDRMAPGTQAALLELLDRLPAKKTKLPPLGTLGASDIARTEAAEALLNHDDTVHLAAVIGHLDALDADTRYTLVSRHGKRLATDHRDVLIGLVGDASTSVRSSAYDHVKQLDLTGDEALQLEALLTRKAGDLRQHVLDLLERRGPEAARASAGRLAASRNAQQRLAGDDLAGRLGDVEEPTEHDGFGLFDPADLTPPITPVDRGTPIGGPDVGALLSGLDAWVEARKTLEVTLEPTSTDLEWDSHAEPTAIVLGELGHWDLRERRLPEPLGTELRAHLDDLMREHGNEAAPSVLLARAARTVEIAARDRWDVRRRADDPWDARVVGSGPIARGIGRIARKPQVQRLALRHGGVVKAFLDLFAAEARDAAALDWALDASEALLAIPAGDHELHLGKAAQGLWQISDVVRWFAADPGAFTDDQAQRLWGLTRWVMDVADPITDADIEGWRRYEERRSPRIPRRAGTGVVLAMFDRGVANEADVLDDLIGPRGPEAEWQSLAVLSGPRSTDRWENLGSDAARALARRARDRVVQVELTRGEAETAATIPVLRLRESGGADVLLAAITALGKTPLQRGYSYGESRTRKAAFSHLIRTAVPADTDTREGFTERAAGLPRTRLLEVACYAPQWAGHIEAALGREGLEDAVWWVHAHTKDSQWDVPQTLRERWQREIATRTELSDEDLTDGAVDVEWFARVRETIGAAGLTEVLGAAKFASSSGGHKRAELYALALQGKVPLKELRTRIQGKRHQDAVRALGLRPLSEQRRDADLRERYELLQAFLRERKQFGSQRQESERRATEIGLANLARTAGFRDPLRLAWAMEAASTADLAEGAQVTRDDVVVRLGVDEDGRAEVTVRRGDKALKAVPAPLRKDPDIVALNERKTDLRRIQSRVRDGLETAMVRGDTIGAGELRALREHVALWPQLRRLVLVHAGGARGVGFPADDGAALVDVDGATHPIAAGDELRIAHPVDLLAGGRWSAWQRHVLGAEIKQPFKQVFRELYRPVAAEQPEGTSGVGVSQRYAGHQVKPAQAQRLLTGRGWTVEAWMPPTRALRHEDLLAQVDVELGWGTAAEVEPPTVESVRFRRLAGDQEPVALAEVPPRAFSEIMRDLDLVVSAAHASGVDPEPSQSTIEARAALVQETAALLSLDGVDVDERRVRIEGKLGTYAVHLGSAQITRLPGGSVCVVPIGAQHRGRVFLPFADDDPRTAEVLAKVLLLARDDEIRDPTILEQLR